MLGLNLLTTQAMRYIIRNISPHAAPPVVLSQVPIHLSCARMNRIFGVMGLGKNHLNQTPNSWNTKSITKS
uniref:Putative ovule protein n=1 Tax=Solanum chacoense TaxID=4108 RepID=A0A0V0GII0_SOLCH